MIKMLKDKIGTILHRGKLDQTKLLDSLYTSVLLVENDYNNVVNDIKNKARKEHFLTLLIDISTRLIRYRLDNVKLIDSFKNLMTLMGTEVIYISKYKNDVFRKVLVWSNTGKKCKCQQVNEILTVKDAPLLFKSILEDGRFIKNGNETDQCIVDDDGNKIAECVFPILINERVWGILGFMKRGKDDDCSWSDEHINICNVLSSIFSSHIKTYKLIDDLKQGSEVVDITNKMAGLNTWSKDEFGKFTYCTASWKKVLFGLDESVNINGKTNSELADSRKNTFIDMCDTSDVHCMEQNEICHYIEYGYIDSKAVVYDIKKSPIYLDNRCRGIIGIAKLTNMNINSIDKILSPYIDTKDVDCLNVSSNAGTYWIKTEDTYNNIVKEAAL